ncbi:MAG: bile acid:sodium symporter family protein [Verrucomicrobiota bacterium]
MLVWFLPLVLLASALAMIWPSGFLWAKPQINLLLAIIMFGMGMTLNGRDFLEVWRQRRLLLVGVSAQYLIMPVLAWLISLALGLPLMALVGMVILGSTPGGTASNVICYLARGNVALSVTLTLCSTLLAPLMTPLLIELYAGQRIAIPFLSIMGNVALVALLPVLAGTVLKQLLGERLERVIHVMPWVSMMALVFIIGVIVAINREQLLAFPAWIMLAVMLHNLLGLGLGYLAGVLFGANEKDRRALAIEVGMQNSGLAASLGITFFKPLAALPGALFSIWHNISGLTLASWWRRLDRRSEAKPASDEGRI